MNENERIKIYNEECTANNIAGAKKSLNMKAVARIPHPIPTPTSFAKYNMLFCTASSRIK